MKGFPEQRVNGQVGNGHWGFLPVEDSGTNGKRLACQDATGMQESLAT